MEILTFKYTNFLLKIEFFIKKKKVNKIDRGIYGIFGVK